MGHRPDQHGGQHPAPQGRIEAGDANGSDLFDPAVEWDGFAIDTFNHLGAHPGDPGPFVVSVTPADGAADVALNAAASVTFSEAVNVTGDWYSLVCGATGPMAATVSGGPTTFTIQPTTNYAEGDTCTFTVNAAGVADQDADDPPDTLASGRSVTFTTTVADQCNRVITPIPTIQGSGSSAAVTGNVSTRGIVVGDYEGPSPTLRGFYLQAASGDGDPATSDGIFVFNGNADSVNLGDLVTVSGSASDFQDQTQVSATRSRSAARARSRRPM